MKVIKAFANSDKKIIVAGKPCTIRVVLDSFEESEFGVRVARSATVTFTSVPEKYMEFSALEDAIMSPEKREVLLSFSGKISLVESAMFAYFGDTFINQVLEA